MKEGASKRKVEDVMRELNALLVEGITVFNDAIYVLCDKPDAFSQNVAEIIKIEDKADHLKEELIELFIKRETMAFSRTDRIQLIESIDIIFDNIEYCARTMQTHAMLIKDYSPIATDFKKYVKDLTEVVKTLSGAIDLAEVDLRKAIEATKLVETLRQAARDQIFNMMENIIKGDFKNPEKMLLYTNIEYLLAILDKAEETSDLLRMFAIKYLVLS
jgi:predicted phosphate transport protein (TIGR00153 family)